MNPKSQRLCVLGCEDADTGDRLMAGQCGHDPELIGLIGPWDSCLDVDPPTGQHGHEHGDACEGNCDE